MLLPPSPDELIPEDRSVRVVSAAVDYTGMQHLLEASKTAAYSSCHPKMMPKVLLHAYTERICY